MSMSAVGILTLLGVVVVMVLWAWHLRGEVEVLRKQNDTLERQKAAFAAELARYKNAQEIVSENRRQADAEVDELHSGDAVGNALDELHKH